MMNEHVVLYFRFMSWLAKERGKQSAAFFAADAARQEIEDQELFKMQANK